ncbi:DNA polymerase III subunit delta' [uncultured Sphingomonas sp.]|uniref:DNA polymerase III subunit delta' n=1 Tax=uncultured Sphingomonas sp. TaxID=158754 RepID=UPI0035CC3598
MIRLFGHAQAQAAFASAMAGGSLHHAWLLGGPEGVGKASFALRAARRLLAAGMGQPAEDFDVPPGDRVHALIDQGAHADLRVLQRLVSEDRKGERKTARGISVDQVRTLDPFLGTKPTYSPRRVIIVDSADVLERGAANALLKNLEEPPPDTTFLLVSHAPGRLLPTIRSRCRLLRFGRLDEAEMRGLLAQALPEAPAVEIDDLVAAGNGSPGRALGFAGLDVAGLDRALEDMARGDPTNAVRAELARTLSLKAAVPRYEAFLDRAPSFIAAHAAQRRGEALRVALDAHDDARALSASALRLSLDAQGTVFEMGGIVARLARAA